MEINEKGFLEELLALRRDNWDTVPTEMDDLFSNGFKFDCFDDEAASTGFLPDSICQEFTLPFEQDLSFNFNEVYDGPFGDEFSAATHVTDTSNSTLDPPPFPVQEDYHWLNMVEEAESGFLVDELYMLNAQAAAFCKAEPIQSPEAPVFNVGTCSTTDSNNRTKKLKGQPSKNLMAERRRRKRLNDRLWMLRSIVPKISKDIHTWRYHRVHEGAPREDQSLQQEIEAGSNELNMSHIFNEVKPNEISFEVERRNLDTRIEICFSGKQGFLLSTLTTLEALGLEVEQCVISCFNDFAMQASCSEDLKQRAAISSEAVKQALFRNAGYAGRCF
ncbi:transcription factor bHLH93-like isoform 2 [Hibiscus syriacus]|uniref:Transcription factor bHLH93-like isoform 2 n=1 Tax=Hibiscus syriacus TaxID=106335 RepID=A0A6A2WYA3_HIBSY|nr:transcription factor bHLH93-like isoform 2 [Hibiscus syriacus]